MCFSLQRLLPWATRCSSPQWRGREFKLFTLGGKEEGGKERMEMEGRERETGGIAG